MFENIDINAIFNGGFIFFATFGSVAAVNFFLKNKLDARQNFGLSVVFALIYSFIPADLGNFILNKVRDAFGVAITLNGMYQFSLGVAKRVGQNHTA